MSSSDRTEQSRWLGGICSGIGWSPMWRLGENDFARRDRALLEQWRKVCTKSRPSRHKLEDGQNSESDEEFDDDENWEYDGVWMSEVRSKHAIDWDDEYMLR